MKIRAPFEKLSPEEQLEKPDLTPSKRAEIIQVSYDAVSLSRQYLFLMKAERYRRIVEVVPTLRKQLEPSQLSGLSVASLRELRDELIRMRKNPEIIDDEFIEDPHKKRTTSDSLRLTGARHHLGKYLTQVRSHIEERVAAKQYDGANAYDLEVTNEECTYFYSLYSCRLSQLTNRRTISLQA